jgi:hypothetical protein
MTGKTFRVYPNRKKFDRTSDDTRTGQGGWNANLSERSQKSQRAKGSSCQGIERSVPRHGGIVRVSGARFRSGPAPLALWLLWRLPGFRGANDQVQTMFGGIVDQRGFSFLPAVRSHGIT